MEFIAYVHAIVLMKLHQTVTIFINCLNDLSLKRIFRHSDFQNALNLLIFFFMFKRGFLSLLVDSFVTTLDFFNFTEKFRNFLTFFLHFIFQNQKYFICRK